MALTPTYVLEQVLVDFLDECLVRVLVVIVVSDDKVL